MPLKEIEVSTENRNDFCNPSAPQGCFLLQKSLIITYRECAFPVTYDYIYCPDAIVPSLVVFNVNYKDALEKAAETDSDCVTVLQGISALNPRVGHNALFAYVAGLLVKHNVDSLNSISQIPTCGSGLTTRVSILASSCYQLCEKVMKNGVLYIAEVQCGSGCCKRTDLVCRGSDGQVYYHGDPSPGSAISYNISCMPVSCTAPLGIPNTGCQAECVRLNEVVY